MKMKMIMAAAAAGAILLAGCTEKYEITHLEEIQLSETFISIPAEGGTVSVALNANVDWAFEDLFETDENVKDENGNTVYEDHDAVKVYAPVPEWLTLNITSGSAGEYTLEFSAEDNDSVGREAELVIKADGKFQNLTVRQGNMTATEATVKDVMDGNDGETFIVTGTCSRIANTSYGNWYMTDDSTDEELYIYGTVDDTGNYNWDSFNIEVGDVVTVRGSKTTYGSTVEIVDARFISVEKSLLQGLETEIVMDADGGHAEAKFLVKGNGPLYDFPEELRSWISLDSIEMDGDTTVVSFTVAPAEDRMAQRSGSITFRSSNADGSSPVPVNFLQYPDPVGSMSEVFAGIESNRDLTVEGVIAATCTNGFLLSKDNDLILVYASDYYDTVKDKVGYSVKVSGTADQYNGGPQIGDVVISKCRKR